MSKEAFDIGAQLKAARETRDISVSSAAMQTNLSTIIIDKLEENRFQAIGAPVFTRGYLTQYARFLGLDLDKITHAFNALEHQPSELRLSSANIASQRNSYKRHHIATWLMMLPMLLLAGVLLQQLMNSESWLMRQFKQAFAQEQMSNVDAGIDGENEIVLQVATDDEVSTLTDDLVAEAEFADIAGASELPTLTSLASEEEEITMQMTDNEEVAVVLENDVSEESAEAQADSLGEENRVQLTISDENWIAIKDKDGKDVLAKIYHKGEVLDLPAEGMPYSMKVGRPESVSLSIGGVNQDLSAYRVGNSIRQFRIEEKLNNE